MGIFSRKTEVYARNTLIAELEARVDSLNEKVLKLKNENADLRATLANLKATNDALLVENQAYLHNLKKAKQADVEVDSFSLENESQSSTDDLADGKKKAHKLEQVVLGKYALELERLDFFMKKWQAYLDKAKIGKKEELSDLLDKLLRVRDIDKIRNARINADEVLAFIDETTSLEEEMFENIEIDEPFFDLEEVRNPKTTISLEQLCKDLGVFEG